MIDIDFKIMNELKKAIKLAVNTFCLKWRATKVCSIAIVRSVYDEQQGTGTMTIEINIKKRK